jgi:hypothetical protein
VALQRALTNEPAVAAQFVDPIMRLLASVCWHMAMLTGGEFWLSTRDAASVLGWEGENAHRKAWRLLGRLERGGVLVCIKRGKPGLGPDREATLYGFDTADESVKSRMGSGSTATAE